jgi:hypothetical protein
VSDYLSGGPIDAVFAALHAAVADLRVERLQVSCRKTFRSTPILAGGHHS